MTTTFDESRLRHPKERPVFIATVLLNLALVAGALALGAYGGDWLEQHPRVARYADGLRVTAIAAVLAPFVLTFARNRRRAARRLRSALPHPDPRDLRGLRADVRDAPHAASPGAVRNGGRDRGAIGSVLGVACRLRRPRCQVPRGEAGRGARRVPVLPRPGARAHTPRSHALVRRAPNCARYSHAQARYPPDAHADVLARPRRDDPGARLDPWASGTGVGAPHAQAPGRRGVRHAGARGAGVVGARGKSG